MNSDAAGTSAEGLANDRAIGFDDFGVDYITDEVDGQQMNDNVAYNMEIRGAEDGLMGHPLESFDENLEMHGQYYEMDDNIMNDNGMMPMQESRFLLNTELGNISVTRDDLISVGVDVTDPNNINVTASQSDALFSLCQDRGDIIQPEYNEFEMMNDMVYPPSLKPEQHETETYFEDNVPGPSTSGMQLDQGKNDELFVYITEEGSITLMGKNGRCVGTYHADELREMGITDPTTLSEAEMQTLVQNLGHSDDVPVSSITYTASPAPLVPYQPEPVPRPRAHPSRAKPRSDADGHIGEVVDIVKGKLGPRKAVIRYCRNNGTYKVQYDDGRFEWVKESEIQRKAKNKTVEKVKVQPGRKRRFVSKTCETPDYHATSTGVIEKPTLIHANSGYCALCDKKIHNSRPAFIVMRIPACRCCAENNALLVEDVIAPVQERSRTCSVNKGTSRSRNTSETNLVLLKEPKLIKLSKDPQVVVNHGHQTPPEL
ncbi:unnamed protein product [Bursaphelenchus okinawaensis]|uniref:Uncharacterized protein n=1 Tax=Bursaphelenchus okinawaensis TaxID=465554 RepID=A0A811K5A7_9BILA|nr:unnamed protein product [Bursaphelenchus okinawaensis]CAG9091625.1 unnamed protein product [Bursaphelenchus okinawaensis]